MSFEGLLFLWYFWVGDGFCIDGYHGERTQIGFWIL